MKYRIKEQYGRFTIEVRGYRYTGLLWWRKKDWQWCSCNILGGVWSVGFPITIPMAPTFKTYDSAKNFVDAITKKTEEPRYVNL